jgi:hypothetical protein
MDCFMFVIYLCEIINDARSRIYLGTLKHRQKEINESFFVMFLAENYFLVWGDGRACCILSVVLFCFDVVFVICGHISVDWKMMIYTYNFAESNIEKRLKYTKPTKVFVITLEEW